MAYAMIDFNGGARFVQVYIQTKTSEVQLSQGSSAAAGSKAEERDPPGIPAERVLEKEEGRMQDFYRAFIDKIRVEAAFIAEVFPNPQKVMSLLLQSLVEFEVKPFVTRLLSSHADNSLAYVMLLEMVHRVSLEQLGGTLKDMFRYMQATLVLLRTSPRFSTPCSQVSSGRTLPVLTSSASPTT